MYPDCSLEVRAAEDRLRVLEPLNLVLAGSLAEVVVLDEEVAVGVELRDGLLERLELRLLGGLLLLGGLDLGVELRLRDLLARDALDHRRTGGLRLAHEALVVRLGGLLLVFGLRDPILQLLDEHVHERNDPVALAVLLLVGVPRRRRRRRGGGRALVQLGVVRLHRGNGSSGDHFRRRRGDHVRPAGRCEDLLLLRQLLHRRLLVQVRAVELEQLVLRLLDELKSRAVLRLEGDELAVLILALLGRFGNRLVQRFHLLLQTCDLVGQSRALLGHLFDGRRTRLDRLLNLRLLLARRLEFFVAVRLLGIVVFLLLSENLDHAVNHRQDLGEVHSLGLQPELDECKLRAVRGALHERRDHVPGAELPRAAGGLLDEAHVLRRLREREGLLEEVKRIVVVQDLDRLADRGDLLSAHLLTRGPLLLLQRALGRQFRHEGLRLLHLRRRVLDVVRGGRDGNCEIAAAHGLRLDRLAGSGDLFLLRGGELLEALGSRLLVADGAVEVLVHLVLHSLEHANDFTRRGAVVAERILLALKQSHDLALLVLVHARRSLHDLLEARNALRVLLDEGLAHALLERGDRTRQRVNVGLRVARRLDELGVLLLADRRRGREVALGRLAVLLVLDELLVELALLGLLRRELALELRDLLGRLLDGFAHAVRVALAVAHKLVEHVLLLLALGLDLLLHILQKSHDLADGVSLSAQGESLYAAPRAQKQGQAHHNSKILRRRRPFA